MDRSSFYKGIVPAMLRLKFQIDPKAFSKFHVEKDEEVIAQRIRDGMDIVKVLAKVAEVVFDIDIPTDDLKIDSVFEKEWLREDIERFYPFTEFMFFKFVLAQPIIVSVVDADRRDYDQLRSVFDNFNRVVLNFIRHTGTMGGFSFMGKDYFKTKMSVTGIMLLIFSDPDKASSFISSEHSGFKYSHFFKKTYVLCWVVDVAREKVTPHSGVPWLMGPVISSEKLQQEVFAR